jgi:hypothetical protein
VKTRTIITTTQAALARAGVRLVALVADVRSMALDRASSLGGSLSAAQGTSVPATTQPHQMSIPSSLFGTNWSIKNVSACFALNGYEDRMKPGGASA